MKYVPNVLIIIFISFLLALLFFTITAPCHPSQVSFNGNEEEIIVERLDDVSAVVFLHHCNTVDYLHVEVEGPSISDVNRLDELEGLIGEAIAELRELHDGGQ